ncbi:hypothetical protein SAMN04489729_0814 [Amycolatopsis lurida]|uniref:hypothetical protein n=1 Tax=Amycolatopsis lurida TaxID=31959 RepID=UPI00089BEA9E|nr:hypothetical protein [Amycolatopsis lurida]SEB38834.1 hypothetical protein SAMN04489729_0814 [Amycolatopsis lurida]
MANLEDQCGASVWRAVLHDTVLHQVASEKSRLRATGKLFGVAKCGVVCTLDTQSMDGFKCPKCFPQWPTEQDTQVIRMPTPRLPKRVPRPVPPPKSSREKRDSGWFDV